ncbi:unnamed protein product [Closterium sp. Naga37s-1]|nr:unnamed protein product [Closterium sp. Naga37s-1]
MDSRKTSSRLPSLRAVEEVLPMYAPRMQLGAGSFGRVFLMEHRQTGGKVAVKTLKKERIVELGMQDKVRREISILLRVRHPNVIRLYNVVETPKYILLLMEYAENGELFDYITQRGRLTEGEARRIFQQIVAGVEYCHRRMVVHRDLKPENILLDASWTVKIADFGLGNLMTEGHFLRTSCGSPNYAAPEVISGRFYCGPEVDVWGCGVVLYTLLCGRLPFDEKSHVALYQKIKAGAYSRPTHVTPAVQDLLARLLVVDPTMRATIPEIRRHPWFLPWFLPSDLIRLQEDTAAGRPAAPLQLNATAISNLQAVRVTGEGRAVLAGNWVQEAFAARFAGPYVLLCYAPYPLVATALRYQGCLEAAVAAVAEEAELQRRRQQQQYRWRAAISERVEKRQRGGVAALLSLSPPRPLTGSLSSPVLIEQAIPAATSFEALAAAQKKLAQGGGPAAAAAAAVAAAVAAAAAAALGSSRSSSNGSSGGGVAAMGTAAAAAAAAAGDGLRFEVVLMQDGKGESLLDLCLLSGSSAAFADFCSIFWHNLSQL